jgi:hypothetical protein
MVGGSARYCCGAGFVVSIASHLRHKNKDVPKVGHPAK